MKHNLLPLVAVALLGASTAIAQVDNARARLNVQFAASGLEVGSQFPDVRIYDAEGKPFQTGDLNGAYSVLVSGCLT